MQFKSFLIISIVLFSGIITAKTQAQKFGKVEDAEWQTGAPADYPEANAVILFDNAKMEITTKNIKVKRHVRIKVLTQAGVDEIGDRTIDYYDKYEKIKHFKAQTITKDGEKLEVKDDAKFEKEDGDFKTLTFSFPQVSPGCIVEYEYERKSEMYWDLPVCYFQHDIYTLKSTFTVSLAPGFEFDMLYKNVPSKYKRPKVEQKPDPNSTMGMQKLKLFTWEVENMPPVKDEAYMSCVADYLSSLRFLLISYTDRTGGRQVFVKNWMDQAHDIQIRFDEFCDSDKEIKQMTEQVIAGCTTPQEKSKAIFDFVKTEFKTKSFNRYLYFGKEQMSDVLKEKTGTAKEKNMILTEMNKAAGISSWPVLISTRAHSKVDPSYPDDHQFNYLLSFVQIGDSWEFLDAADRNSLYGILQPQCLTDIGLLVDGDNSQMVKLTIKPIDSKREDITDMTVAADGTVACSTHCYFSGYYASDYAEKYDNNTPDDFIDSYIKDRLSVACNVNDYKCYTDSLHDFTIDASFTSDEIARKLDNNFIIKPVSFAYNKNPFNSENRFFPVDFTYPFEYKNVVNIDIESAPTEIHLPEDISLDFGGITINRNSTFENNKIVVTQTLNVTKPEFTPGVYHKLKELFDKFAQMSEDEVTFILND